MPKRINQRGDVTSLLRPQADRPAPLEMALEHLSHKDARLALEPDHGAGLELLAGVHQGLPDRRPAGLAGHGLLQQEALDRPTAGHAATQQPRCEDPRVVDDKKITRPEKPRKVGDSAVRDGSTRPIEDEQA